jgi:DNA-binding IclR family transcriptional regulator
VADTSNSRVIDVINFLAAHPTESFTLSEISDRLSISHGSAHRVLTTLTEARYLSRHPRRKTYSLGLALVAIGQAALERHRVVDVARREMARLAYELGVQCIAYAIVDDEMLHLAKEGTSQTPDGLARVGERRPFMPPGALGHVAWASPDAVEAYLAKAPKGVSAEMRAHLMTALDVIRRRGYAIAAIGPAWTALRQIIIDHADDYREEKYWSQMQALVGQLSKSEVQLLSLEDVGSARISYISAPVFSPSGEVVLELMLSGIPDILSAAEVERYAERLRAAAAVVTSEALGRMPRI